MSTARILSVVNPMTLLSEAISALIGAGHVVERATDIPGLYYVDNGPELTSMQLIDYTHSLGLL